MLVLRRPFFETFRVSPSICICIYIYICSPGFLHKPLLPQRAGGSCSVLASFCGYTASKSALSRGYGRDRAVNNMIAFFWAVANALQWCPHFQWIPSDLNISEPLFTENISIGVERGLLGYLHFRSHESGMSTSGAVSAASSLSWSFE